MLGKVSVILPLFNAVDLLEETVDSVLNQSHKVHEIIIVDDVSTDGSYELALSLASRHECISVLRNEKNCGGPAWGRNLGLSNATGDFIAFIDSDDLWDVQKTEIQLKLLAESGCSFISSDKYVFSGQFVSQGKLEENSGHEIAYDKIMHSTLLMKNSIANSSVMICKELFENIRFREDKKYIAVEDYHCWLRMHQLFDHSIKVKLPLLNYRVVGTSISRSKFSMFLKVKNLLENYKVSENGLGLKRYFYLLTYAVKSVQDRLL